MKRRNLCYKIFCVVLSLFLIPIFALPVFAADYEVAMAEYGKEIEAVSCILIEAQTGLVIYEKNADEALPPASVTKIMSILLVLEAVDDGVISLTDKVQISENAASMGGSQVYLEAGEEFSVDELLKCVIVASANDATVALAEFISGSEEAFIAKMNSRATELGMKNSHFENTTGLDDSVTNHVTSARDIAIMSMELLKHETVYNYTTIWMDTIRDGAFGLSNTNRLIRFYKGATGLKTGSTSKAKFCISATAERDGLKLIAVIMAAPTRDVRNAAASSLLDFGFANYSYYVKESAENKTISVTGGVKNTLKTVTESFSCVLKKGDEKKVEMMTDIPDTLAAPLVKGQKIGTVTYTCGGKELGTADILADEDIAKINFGTMFTRLFKWFILSP